MDFYKDVQSTSPISCTTIDPHLPTIDDCLRMTKAGAAAPGELWGFAGQGASNESGVVKIVNFFCGRYVFRNFKYETNVILSEYVVPQQHFIDIETDLLE